MNKIKILPPQEAQKIAAGEVIERPASVVKEIIENSIDAGATQISLYIKKSGKELIRIVDNGQGMSPDDAKLCFTNHATSKIYKLDDLETINSFGFRGEALASISAVSKVTLITKSNETNVDLGIKLEYHEGKLITQENISCPFGTDLQIHDLFYNTPARKKFLKQDETEWNQIQQIFQAFCLSTLHIHFKLFRDDKLILNTPATQDVAQRTTQIWGHNFSQNLIPLSVQQDPSTSSGRTEMRGNFSENLYNKIENHKKSVRSERSIVSMRSQTCSPFIFGFISNHNFWRYGRQQIFFFVNKRSVKNKELSKALLKGYLNVLPPARFPAAFIFINLQNSEIDVNVHPRKEEVLFSKPKTVELSLQKVVTQTLEKNLSGQLQGKETLRDAASQLLRANGGENKSSSIKKNLSYVFSKQTSPNDLSHSVRPEPFDFTQDARESRRISNYPVFTVVDFEKQNEKINKEGFPSPAHPEEERSDVSKDRTDPPTELPTSLKLRWADRMLGSLSTHIIGQFLNTYILIETDDNLIIIDQHAAHERILYEKFLKNFEKKDGTRLLFPEILNLSEHQIKIVLNEKDFFLNQGIEIDQISNNEIAIKTSPPKIQSQSLKELVLEIIAFIEENEYLETEIFRKKLNEHMHSQMACKMAVKAGNKLTQEMMQAIIDDLQKTDNRFICAHGRPTTWSLSKYQIEKNFRRK